MNNESAKQIESLNCCAFYNKYTNGNINIQYNYFLNEKSSRIKMSRVKEIFYQNIPRKKRGQNNLATPFGKFNDSSNLCLIQEVTLFEQLLKYFDSQLRISSMINLKYSTKFYVFFLISQQRFQIEFEIQRKNIYNRYFLV